VMTVWIVVLRDRHFDDVVDVFASKAGAESKVATIKAGYAESVFDPKWTWNERSKTWNSYDDGPSIQVAQMEVQP